MHAGNPELLGATPDDTGTNFAVYSAVADGVELCLFSADGQQQQIHDLPACADGVWHGHLPGCRAGQLYGFRVHGPYDPDKGLRCNAAKLLLDPYAREIAGGLQWHPAVFDYVNKNGEIAINDEDSAPHVPKSVVRAGINDSIALAHKIPWADTVFYECNVRGYTMRHPAIEEASQGTFDGLRHEQVLRYLKALGVTSIELMPVHTFVDEHHLAQQGLRNFWGYNSVGFFAPMQRYARGDSVSEFRDMVRALHDAGLEVILDVAYNHTGEGNHLGPSLVFRGIDNLTYYRTEPDDHGAYINDTGCGNTLDFDHIRVRQMMLDSLEYWTSVMGVDGFRFDLATVLGRRRDGFSPTHPVLSDISNHPSLRNAKLIAEPWDPGPGGYQLGHFPPRWAEWNDRFRDDVRQFWRGDQGKSGDLAMRLRGSSDLFEPSLRRPLASVNLITAHDGFTLRDTVSYEHRHNEANGEDNRDGHAHNFSRNYGAEGDTEDDLINKLRRRQRLNMLATLFFSQGTPLLLAGDEFGHTQEGNNNGYAQDNEICWLDWSLIDEDPEFLEQVRDLIWLRREHALLRIDDYVHGLLRQGPGTIEIRWINKDGQTKRSEEWAASDSFAVLIEETSTAEPGSSVAVIINRDLETLSMQLPETRNSADWHLAFSTAGPSEANIDGRDVVVPQLSVTLLTLA
jgi:glycogen operon protein